MSSLEERKKKLSASAAAARSFYVFLFTCTRVAISQLQRHKMRSFLTALGILIGVSGVVTIVSLGEGLRNYFNEAVGGQANASLLYIMPKSQVRNGMWNTQVKAFKSRDIDAIARSEYVAAALGGHIDYNAVVKHGWRSQNNLLSMSPPAHFELDKVKIARGRFYTKADEMAASAVCVIGADVPKELYEKNEDPLGSTLTINGTRFTVLGILESKSALDGGQVNKAIYIPLVTGQRRLLGSDDVFWIAAQVYDSTKLAEAREDITAILRASRRIRSGADDDFSVTSPEDWAKMLNGMVNVLIMVFGVVAVIALLVGGIGVMNIMLVSVKERTREIGLRKALGATPGAITWQFLVEAITLALTGGMLGLLSGYGTGVVASLVLKAMFNISWVPSVPFHWIAIVMLTSMGLGLAFGVYPAWRAGRLDPIIALRYE